MSVKLQCQAPKGLADILGAAKRRLSTKSKSLEKFVALALKDKGTYKGPGFGTDEFEPCTLTISASEYADTLDYRDKYKLNNKKAFFLHALQHGATIWWAANQPRAE